MNDELHLRAYEMIRQAKHALIIQADNPDGDSLGSALAIEEIVESIGPKASLYCGVETPGYLKHMTSWSRVHNELPNDFDLIIFVDVSTNTLLDKVQKDKNFNMYQKTPKLVFDHHKTVGNEIDSQLSINLPECSSTGELIYEFIESNKLKLSVSVAENIMNAILSDSQGLTNNATTKRTYEVMAKLVECGVDRPSLEEKRRQLNKMSPEIFRYKSRMIDNAQLLNDGTLALVVVSQEEINQYSPLYNPAALITPDLLQVENVQIAVVVKVYDDGKITGAIRSSNQSPVAAQLAEKLGGGGHDYASGFKILGTMNKDETVKQIADEAKVLIDNLN